MNCPHRLLRSRSTGVRPGGRYNLHATMVYQWRVHETSCQTVEASVSAGSTTPPHETRSITMLAGRDYDRQLALQSCSDGQNIDDIVARYEMCRRLKSQVPILCFGYLPNCIDIISDIGIPYRTEYKTSNQLITNDERISYTSHVPDAGSAHTHILELIHSGTVL